MSSLSSGSCLRVGATIITFLSAKVVLGGGVWVAGVMIGSVFDAGGVVEGMVVGGDVWVAGVMIGSVFIAGGGVVGMVVGGWW